MGSAVKTRRIHAFVFCWPGREVDAKAIAAAIEGTVERLTVLYKNDTGIDERGAGEWVRIPSDWFYGRQCRKAVDLFDGDVMLQIQADARFNDWPRLVERFRRALDVVPQMGIWTPNVYHTWYTPTLTEICKVFGDELSSVTVSDGVVWGLSADVIERMRQLDYSINNYGWGITEAAAAIANGVSQMIVMDNTLLVDHPQGSGYDRTKALEQSADFTAQLSVVEQSYLRWVNVTCDLRKRRDPGRFVKKHWRTMTARLFGWQTSAHHPATSKLRVSGSRAKPLGEDGA